MRHVLLLSFGLLVVLLAGCVPVGPQGAATSTQYVREKVLRYADAEYEPGIRSVLLVPNTGQLSDDMQYPFIGLGTANNLRLEFDEMGSQFSNYYYKILPANWNWTPGILQDMELADAVNEYIMDGYTLSSGTRVPYVHYYAQLPRLKLSGNYVVVVYRGGNAQDIVLTRRFCVFESLVSLAVEPKFALGSEQRFTHQQVDVNVGYGDYPIVNPISAAHLVIRQNGRWDNAITNLPPLYIRDENKTLDYHYFSGENTFEGNNEWRQFDIRSLRYRGINIASMIYDNTHAAADLLVDQSRDVKTYSQYIDLNGRYAIVRAETQDIQLEANTADYVQTTFHVQLPAGRGLEQGKLYIFGQLSNFQTDERFRLRPDSATAGKFYTATVPLKQGIYSYQIAYIAPGQQKASFTEMEGSYSQTENDYDALFYYRPIGARYDQLVAYRRVNYNGRR